MSSSYIEIALDGDRIVKALSDDGFTPPLVEVRANRAECVQLLLERGANVSTETTFGSNIYNLAVKHRSERIMRLLLDYDEEDGALTPPSTNRPFSSPPGTLVSPARSPVTRQTLRRLPPGTLVSPIVQSCITNEVWVKAINYYSTSSNICRRK